MTLCFIIKASVIKIKDQSFKPKNSKENGIITCFKAMH